jgi:hypothetical protein
MIRLAVSWGKRTTELGLPKHARVYEDLRAALRLRRMAARTTRQTLHSFISTASTPLKWPICIHCRAWHQVELNGNTIVSPEGACGPNPPGSGSSTVSYVSVSAQFHWCAWRKFLLAFRPQGGNAIFWRHLGARLSNAHSRRCQSSRRILS